ncbi:flagellar biosynthesis protein FliQ [Thermoanaerobacterium thermosaccharolyticum]|jgi:flagellar biosynthesis protein FliQ|uniref:Flagellar biosynthetic protein FliQ n=2 Tax=Thermoanaerobacterium thermosaccharolyticum TaxID=1517 RepID=A0A231VH38_THETR|nr:flagellar biosynthesis protein FliQ [Thermoanaerobacterium thermosaccharolyticum]AGB19046.1 flagellar biosynthetic protein FliQ [Thermoanaerobacterium thermosaccharolyticum M0795]AST59005.1 flagellar biosynthetic protein/protein secretion [Thermoanaerobacterium thermosaccharolyticum]KAA5807760.1 flagellar biosynthesis protein FliQ [Thermoanaerobacterium thermosaccharolyticum]MBE0068032.1 flagellar biosynthesis protein FliQ [Thermoanaerobacterium thermosaccharolyticum]MBE0227776.1 flagellar 
MDPGVVLDIGREALMVTMIVSAPLLIVSLLIGLIISIFQATTQIQEQTLTFVPKILAIFASIILFGPWMLTTLINYTQKLILNINNFIK